MVNKIGILLREIRAKSNENMREMASKFGISVSLLSAIENGLRNIPPDFEDKIMTNYSSFIENKEILDDALCESQGLVKVDLSNSSENKKKLVYSLKGNKLDEETIQKLCEIIDKGGSKNEK